MNILLAGYDKGAQFNLEMISNCARSRGHKVMTFFGQGIESFLNDPDWIRNELPKFDVVITGTASFKKDPELALGALASRYDIPWVRFADTHSVWGGEGARGRVGNAILLVASPLEIEAAKAFGHRKVHYLGPPPYWRKFLEVEIPKLPGRDPGLPLIMVEGVKDASITNQLLTVSVAACNLVFGPSGYQLVFKPHFHEPEMTLEQLEFRKQILNNVPILETDLIPLEILPACDLLICTGGATDSIAAAMRRQRVIYYSSPAVRARLAKQQGSPDWFPAVSGACQSVEGQLMALAIVRLFNEEVRAEQVARQKEVYPDLPGDERTEEKIVDFLESLV